MPTTPHVEERLLPRRARAPSIGAQGLTFALACASLRKMSEELNVVHSDAERTRERAWDESVPLEAILDAQDLRPANECETQRACVPA